MIIYWLLFAFPAVMALAYPLRTPRLGYSPAQKLALGLFVVLYVMMGWLRFETGGDWLTYDEMFEDMRVDTLAYALSRTDLFYGLTNWFSAQVGGGLYLVNAICAAVLGYGVVAVAARMREPWLAVLIAVPYLMIVVGFGYVRQGAAIGMVLMAIASLDRAKSTRTILYLLGAMAWHSTSVFVFPVFAIAMSRGNRLMAFTFSLIAAVAYFTVLAPRLGQFEAGYIDAEYDSGGALVRLLMGLAPAILILIRRKSMPGSARVQMAWIAVAIANVIALVALAVSPSSTAVDRIALFFSIIQIAAFGEIRDLLGVGERSVFLVRLALIAVAAAIQIVWLVFGTHAIFWVPYRSVLEFL